MLLINKISALRKIGLLDESLKICNSILRRNQNNFVVLYHKIMILYNLKKYNESIKIFKKILDSYPKNSDVLFDQATNFAQTKNTAEAISSLKSAIIISSQFKSKAKQNKAFESLLTNNDFLRLIDE